MECNGLKGYGTPVKIRLTINFSLNYINVNSKIFFSTVYWSTHARATERHHFRFSWPTEKWERMGYGWNMWLRWLRLAFELRSELGLGLGLEEDRIRVTVWKGCEVVVKIIYTVKVQGCAILIKGNVFELGLRPQHNTVPNLNNFNHSRNLNTFPPSHPCTPLKLSFSFLRFASSHFIPPPSLLCLLSAPSFYFSSFPTQP